MENNSLSNLCEKVRRLLKKRRLKESYQIVCNAMANEPHSPVPHNLMGIILEMQNNHLLAMRHFRASYSLDPTYLPARYNLEHYGNLSNKCFDCAFTEKDFKE